MNNSRILFVAIVVLFISCAKDEFNIPRYEISYDIYPETKLDVYSNDYAQYTLKPVIVYIHGGSWCSGDKSEWNKKQTQFFIDNGYVCVSINYRLSPLYTSDTFETHIMHPIHIMDVVNAIAWIESHIVEYGGDPARLILIGHSAGAHLAALSVTNQKYLENAGVNVRNIIGVCLLDGGAYLTMDDLIYSDAAVMNMIYNVVGTDSSSWMWEDFSPMANIKKNRYIPSVILIHSDNEYRVLCNKKFAEVLYDAGFECDDNVLTVYSHSDIFFNFPFYREDELCNKDYIISFFNNL